MENVLVIGAGGQLGMELVEALRAEYGEQHVVASDINEPKGVMKEGIFERLDVMDKKALGQIVDQYKIDHIYHLAAILSATGEKNPKLAWSLNMDGLIYVLDLMKEKQLKTLYWPSSIAVFGPNTPMNQTPQHCVMDPNTVYGISKQAGERWCEYYFLKHGVDVRSLRYPGLIGYKSLPGGGTTDYAVDIYHKAIANTPFECFLSENTYLPMMYMPDAIKATLDIMHAESAKIKVRSSYNLGGISFSPKEIAASIQKFKPNFSISYKPDFRQQIADSWPNSIDDSAAQQDWGWKHQYDLDAMTKDILDHLPAYLPKLTS
jgi:nucleoside-diphosphate-sugar epimerase